MSLWQLMQVAVGGIPADALFSTDFGRLVLLKTGLLVPIAALGALNHYGNSGFDILRGPGLAAADASLSRSFRLRETLRLETRFSATNLLNRTNFALPNRFLGVESSGVISHTVTPARQLQLAVRVVW